MSKTRINKEIAGFDISLWERLQKERYAQREKRRKLLLNEIVLKIKEFFRDRDVKSVYLFGSLLREGGFYEFSDIDIAVEGLKDDYFEVATEIEHFLDRDVDLVEMEKCRFRDYITKYGLKIK